MSFGTYASLNDGNRNCVVRMFERSESQKERSSNDSQQEGKELVSPPRR